MTWREKRAFASGGIMINALWMLHTFLQIGDAGIGVVAILTALFALAIWKLPAPK